MTHPEILLGPYVRGELTAAERTDVEAHIKGCADCARAADETRAVLAALGASPPAPPGVRWDRYAADLRARRDALGRAAPGRWLRSVGLAAPAAAAVALALVALQPLQRDPVLDALAPDDVVIARRLELLQQYPIVERLDLLEDFDVIRTLDEVPVRDG